MQTFNFKKLVVVASATAAAFVMIGQGSAQAQQVVFAGTANGSFNGTPGTTGGGTTTSLFGPTGLTYTAAAFNTFSPGTFPNTVNLDLGFFTLGDSLANYNGQTFNLLVNFTQPSPISGGGNSMVSALLQGSVFSGPGGATGSNVQINFSQPSPGAFTFGSGSNAGSFTFTVDPVLIVNRGAGVQNRIAGRVTVAAVPELSTVAGMGSLLAGGGLTMFGGVIRRRRKNGTLAA